MKNAVQLHYIPQTKRHWVISGSEQETQQLSDVNEEVWKGMEMVIRCGERKAKIGIRIENVRGHLWSLTED